MLEIITNNVPRFTLDAFELTEKERKDFDYLNWEAIDTGNDSATFIRYKGELIDLGDLEYSTHTDIFPGWDCYRSDTFFSGILIRFCEDIESVIMGRYYS